MYQGAVPSGSDKFEILWTSLCSSNSSQLNSPLAHKRSHRLLKWQSCFVHHKYLEVVKWWFKLGGKGGQRRQFTSTLCSGHLSDPPPTLVAHLVSRQTGWFLLLVFRCLSWSSIFHIPDKGRRPKNHCFWDFVLNCGWVGVNQES